MIVHWIRRGMVPRAGLFVSLLLAQNALLSVAQAGKVETWRQDSASAFSKGKKDKVVISDAGRVRLAQQLAPTETLDANRVWDLARTADGAVYAATGDEGKVFK
ncbi:MAG TPA: hypothetical protein VGZ22_08030, partial [Isosphaeraceae bacterium]|nr:hypothetical protein [Isosphaeraceae bacterium]